MTELNLRKCVTCEHSFIKSSDFPCKHCMHLMRGDFWKAKPQPPQYTRPMDYGRICGECGKRVIVLFNENDDYVFSCGCGESYEHPPVMLVPRDEKFIPSCPYCGEDGIRDRVTIGGRVRYSCDKCEMVWTEPPEIEEA